MMKQDSALKYSRPILWFVAVLLLFLIAVDAVIVSQQRKLLTNIRQNDVRNELDIMGALVHEALLKHDYGTVENFLVQWGKEHKDVLEIRAITPNNFVLAEYKSSLPVVHSFRIEHRVSYEGEYLITLELVKDFTIIDNSMDKLSLKLVAGSFIFISLLGFFLWHTVNKTAMKPLEKEIAERKKAEKALRESEQRYRMLFESAGDAIFIIEAEGGQAGNIVAANKTAADVHGYTIDELLHKNIRDLDTPESAQNVPEVIRRILCGEWVKSEMGHRRKDRTVFPVEVNAGLLEIDDHKYILAFDRDITERKKAEEQLKKYSEELEKINEEMKSFVYIVSHDLRAPLVNIRGFSDELGRSIKEFTPLLEKCSGQVDARDKQRTDELLQKDMPEALGFIGSSVTRMDALINSILKLSRLGRIELNPELLRTEEIVHTLLKSLAHQIDMHKAAVTIGPLPDLVVDRTAAELLFGNLLDNALKYLEPARPGKIEVTAEQHAGETIFTVRDNGRGIAKGDTHKIFELFRRVGRQDVPGEGMGLTYVKTLVWRLGGRIWCESEPGKGTAFCFTISQGPASLQAETASESV